MNNSVMNNGTNKSVFGAMTPSIYARLAEIETELSNHNELMKERDDLLQRVEFDIERSLKLEETTSRACTQDHYAQWLVSKLRNSDTPPVVKHDIFEALNTLSLAKLNYEE